MTFSGCFCRVLLLSALLFACGSSDGEATYEDISGADVLADGAALDVVEAEGLDLGMGDLDRTDQVDETEFLFDSDHVIDVQIEIDPGDWGLLQQEGRGLATLFSGCGGDYEYTYFEATATVDGEEVESVGIRKKGFLGSLSVLRPSLKLNFGKYVPGQTAWGMKRMTLNNDRQDPSHTHQVMSYAMFRQAGVVAPRCNFARVTVNGEDLGIYSHVESIKKPFLARHFESDNGNLYEGQGADFAPAIVDKFERKTNKNDFAADGLGPDRSDLQEVIDSLAVEDSELLGALEQVIDIDSFLTYWAMEAMVGHWDGYSGNRNNFYIYRDPETELFHFIPWGTDGTFAEGHAFLPSVPKSVYAWSVLAHRLYFVAETRALYVARFEELLDQIWDEEVLLAEVDRIEELVAPSAKALEAQREYLATRRPEIEKELANGGGGWMFGLHSKAGECKQPLEVSGTFEAIWNTNENFVTSSNVQLNLEIDGEMVLFDTVYNNAGPRENWDEEEPGFTSVVLYGNRKEANSIIVNLMLPTLMMVEDDVPFHGLEVFGIALEVDIVTDEWKMVGYVGDGVISFAEAGIAVGEKVSGSFEAKISQ